MGDILFELLTSAMDFGPRWLRIGCTTVLTAFFVGLLLWAFWPRN